MQNLDTLLAGLRAAGDHTRLRLLALCARSELSVSELTGILGQSQPRVSRHLKLMVEAGLLERFPEGTHVFYRLAERASAAPLALALVALLQNDDPALNRDLSRLNQVSDARAQKAQIYFQEVSVSWDHIRALHLPQEQLELALREAIGEKPVGDLLDIGTGTGRILEILSDRAERCVGVDFSTGMLAVARANLERAGLSHMQVRKGDMYQLPVQIESFDLAILHMVLHYSEDPSEVINEAARVLRAGARLFVVDFAAHSEEYLRDTYQHRRLGFTDNEIKRFFKSAGLRGVEPVQLVGDPLTVNIWPAHKPAEVLSLAKKRDSAHSIYSGRSYE
jgi:ubiquinone/menaquinone biosynthesis C-methylase UbiE